MWFMHDGAPPHFLRTVRQHLNQTFGEQWIELELAYTIPWPQSSEFLGVGTPKFFGV
jgi:hypothetical protein